MKASTFAIAVLLALPAVAYAEGCNAGYPKTAKSEPCVFPFIFNGKEYNSCTSANENDGKAPFEWGNNDKKTDSTVSGVYWCGVKGYSNAGSASKGEKRSWGKCKTAGIQCGVRATGPGEYELVQKSYDCKDAATWREDLGVKSYTDCETACDEEGKCSKFFFKTANLKNNAQCILYAYNEGCSTYKSVKNNKGYWIWERKKAATPAPTDTPTKSPTAPTDAVPTSSPTYGKPVIGDYQGVKEARCDETYMKKQGVVPADWYLEVLSDMNAADCQLECDSRQPGCNGYASKMDGAGTCWLLKVDKCYGQKYAGSGFVTRKRVGDAGTPAPTAAPPPTSAPTSDCSALAGYVTGPCVFPFKYKGTTYNDCVSIDEVTPQGYGGAPQDGVLDDGGRTGLWCGTDGFKDNSNSNRKKWGFCKCSPQFYPPTSAPTRAAGPGVYELPNANKGKACKKDGSKYLEQFSGKTLVECKALCDENGLCSRAFFNNKNKVCQLFQAGSSGICTSYSKGNFDIWVRVGEGTYAPTPPTLPPSPTSKPTSAPTPPPSPIAPSTAPTNAPTAPTTGSPTGATPKCKVTIQQSGYGKTGNDCKIPFTYNGVTYDSCASIAEVKPKGWASKLRPKDDQQGRKGLWCPDGNWNGKQKNWGFCQCDWYPDTDAPTAAPTVPGTESPTEAPTNPTSQPTHAGEAGKYKLTVENKECNNLDPDNLPFLKVDTLTLELCQAECDLDPFCSRVFIKTESETDSAKCRLLPPVSSKKCVVFKDWTKKKESGWYMYERTGPATGAPTTPATEAPVAPTEAPTTAAPITNSPVAPSVAPSAAPTAAPTPTPAPITSKPTAPSAVVTDSPTASPATDKPTPGGKPSGTDAPTAGSPPTKTYEVTGELEIDTAVDVNDENVLDSIAASIAESIDGVEASDVTVAVATRRRYLSTKEVTLVYTIKCADEAAANKVKSSIEGDDFKEKLTAQMKKATVFASDELVVDEVNVEEVKPIDAPTSKPTSAPDGGDNTGVIIGVVVGLLGVAVIVLFYFHLNQPQMLPEGLNECLGKCTGKQAYAKEAHGDMEMNTNPSPRSEVAMVAESPKNSIPKV